MNIRQLERQGMLSLPLGEELDGMHISDLAGFAGLLAMGHQVTIGDRVYVEADCTIEDDVVIEKGARVGRNSRLERGVALGEKVVVLRDSTVGQNSDIRTQVIIGRGVSVPPEAQIGAGMIVPSQETIVTLGRFGTSQRVVTIHGSDEGPRFSIGCQFSVSEAVITDRIMAGTETSEQSARHYREYVPEFSAIGARVQRFYERETQYIEDLRELAAELREQPVQ